MGLDFIALARNIECFVDKNKKMKTSQLLLPKNKAGAV